MSKSIIHIIMMLRIKVKLENEQKAQAQKEEEERLAEAKKNGEEVEQSEEEDSLERIDSAAVEDEGDESGNRRPLPTNNMHALISNSNQMGEVSDMTKNVVTSVVNKR